MIIDPKWDHILPVFYNPVVLAMFISGITHYQNGMIQFSGRAGGLVIHTTVIKLHMMWKKRKMCLWIINSYKSNFVVLSPTLLAGILCTNTFAKHMLSIWLNSNTTFLHSYSVTSHQGKKTLVVIYKILFERVLTLKVLWLASMPAAIGPTIATALVKSISLPRLTLWKLRTVAPDFPLL